MKSDIRMCAISNLSYGTYFSFEKDGPIRVAHHRYLKPGKTKYRLVFSFFGMNAKGSYYRVLNYHLVNAQKRLVYLHDYHPSSALPDEIKVIKTTT